MTLDYVSPRLTFYASNIRTRQQAEDARADRSYWAEKDREGVTCLRCDQDMEDKDCAEGCEDLSCPFIGGEQ